LILDLDDNLPDPAKILFLDKSSNEIGLGGNGMPLVKNRQADTETQHTNNVMAPQTRSHEMPLQSRTEKAPRPSGKQSNDSYDRMA